MAGFKDLGGYEPVRACLNFGKSMNAGRIEDSDGEYYFYTEGVTTSVSLAIQAVHKDRIQIGKALGCKLKPVNQAIHEAGLGREGSLYNSIVEYLQN
jgi:opine dehydrogenase